jgi:hypothetical protein
VFEIFKRSLGKAGMCYSQPARVDYMCKNMWVGGKRFFGDKAVQGTRTRPAGNRWSPKGHGPQFDRLQVGPFFCCCNFGILSPFFCVMKMGLAF